MRPEDIELVEDGNGQVGQNELPGTVEALLFLGDHYECRVNLGENQAILVHAPRSTMLQEGSPVRVAVAPEKLTVWPQ